jgi:hypothetical protein
MDYMENISPLLLLLLRLDLLLGNWVYQPLLNIGCLCLLSCHNTVIAGNFFYDSEIRQFFLRNLFAEPHILLHVSVTDITMT